MNVPLRPGSSRWTIGWRWCQVIWRRSVAACRWLLTPRRVSESRRNLLRGRFGKLVPPSGRGAVPQSSLQRYPISPVRHPGTESTESTRPPRSLGGISIEAVPPTDLRPAQLPVHAPVFRPPGAVAETQFLAGCTRCDACVAACPYQAITKVPPRMGSLAGTPTILADAQACWMCHDFPCIAACEPGVLVASVPKIMGTARITEHLCLAHHGTTCTVCSERCPVPGALDVQAGKPTVVEDLCTGCGVCRYVCPAPENAVLLMPALIRPPHPC